MEAVRNPYCYYFWNLICKHVYSRFKKFGGVLRSRIRLSLMSLKYRPVSPSFLWGFWPLGDKCPFLIRVLWIEIELISFLHRFTCAFIVRIYVVIVTDLSNGKSSLTWETFSILRGKVFNSINWGPCSGQYNVHVIRKATWPDLTLSWFQVEVSQFRAKRVITYFNHIGLIV